MKIKFFLLPYIKPTDSNFQHQEICLAEGFKTKNISFCGNINYWFDNTTKTYLIQKEEGTFQPTVCIYSSLYFHKYYDQFKLANGCINILIDNEDGYNTACDKPRAKEFTLILRTHFTLHHKYNVNVVPWAFGLSNRIIQELKLSYNLPIKNRCLSNFRVSYNLRELAINRINPIISKRFEIIQKLTEGLDLVERENLSEFDYWNQTGRRHNTEYYKLLNSSLLTHTFGGVLEYKSSLHRIKEWAEKRIKFRLSNNFNLYQYDSWRLWEVFASNSCPLNIDFSDWNILLPEMPVNGIHFWGVKGINFEKSAKDLMHLKREEIMKISQAGKNWSLKNYSPVATAKRFIKHIESL